MDSSLTTNFASPERSSDKDIKSAYDLLSEERQLLDILGAVAGITAILDEKRQIVYANDDFIGILGFNSIEQILGKRPGEAVGCIHADEEAAGCGTAGACVFCGAVNAIIESQKQNIKVEKETRITSLIKDRLINWDLRITSAPVLIRNRAFYIFSVLDISNEKRRENLERAFFHDILNSAGNLNGLLSMLKEGADEKESRQLIDLSEEVSRELIEEILVHRQIRAAENGDLSVKTEKLIASEVLRSTVSRISGNPVARSRNIIISDQSDGHELFTDRLLLQRILINMLKNALEASEENENIYAEVTEQKGRIIFSVRNNFVMSEDVKVQIFQRSFSTHGKGRGLGTYSIRLIGEKYLGGTVGFTSTDNEGTIFFIDLPAH